MKMVIYKITNQLNGKPYVGQTKQPIERRFLQHFYSKSPLGQAMRKCGIENFTIEIIERCYSQSQLNEREIFWIRVLKSKQPYGYNVREGGGGHEHHRRKLAFKESQISYSTRNIFQNALLAHKYPILETKINYPLDNNLDKKIIIDFSIKTQIHEEQVIEWVVKIVPNSIVEAKNFFETLFATLYVQETTSTIMRYSVVVSDRKIFKTLKGVYQDVQVDDYISIILIDNKRQAVADEFILARRNTQDNVKSIFI